MNSVQLVKAAKDLASRGYGESAASVLNTGKRLAEIQEKISADDFRVFRDQVAWHPKVFSKVLTIGKDSRLTKYCKDLPDSYSAIYAISLLTDEDFAASFRNPATASPSVFCPKSSSFFGV